MRKKGFTLVELLAVIVVLSIIALIAVPIVLNSIESAKKSALESELKNIKSAAKFYQSREELSESVDECRYFSFTSDVEQEVMINGKMYVPVKELELKGSAPKDGEVEICPENIAINISDGNYSGVSDGDNFIVVKGDDLSKGDKVPAVIKKIRTATTSTSIQVTVEAVTGKYGKIKKYEYSLNDNKHYVESGKTYLFENLDFYTEYTIYVRVTTNGGIVTEDSIKVTTDKALLSVTANGYTGTYDGASHGITVTSNGATIKYGTEEDTYNLDESPMYTDVGTYTVYYEVTREKYKTVTGSKMVTISKAPGSLELSSTSGSYTYPTEDSFTITKNTSGGTLSCATSNSAIATCSLSGKTVTVTPGTTAGIATITVTSDATKNYNATSASYTATIANGILSVTANGYTGVYDGASHGITVTSNGATIKYGTSIGSYTLTSSPTYTNAGNYTVYYQVSKAGYKTVTGSKTVVISKAEGGVALSATSGTVTYPTAGSFTVTENIGGGTLSCASSNSAVATCSVSGTKVTVTPGTTAGIVTLTVTSATTDNYKAASASYTVTTASGTLSVTASDYTGTYDGASHGITVTCSGATITYSSDGTTYTSEKPTYTNASDTAYTTYYKITKPGYKTVTGSKKVTINRANGNVTLSATSGTVTYPTAGSFTVTKNTSGGTLSCATSNSAIATCSVSGTTVTVKPGTTAGSATLTITSAKTTNYNAASASYVATTASGTLSVTASDYTGTYDGASHGITVTCSGATITYSSDGTTYTSEKPTYTNASDTAYTTYYKITKPGYKTVTGSKKVTINRANGNVTLSTNSGTLTYPNSSSFTITKNTSGGTLSCATSNSAIATCSISGTTVTVKPGTTAGNATITVTSAKTTNYNAASASYVATTASGTLSVTASDYTGTYDGNAHGITVTSSGATITYSSDGTTYKSEKPTYTNASDTAYTTYYKITKPGYKTVTGSKKVTIKRASNTLTLYATSGTITAGNSTTITVSKNTSGGTLSCTRSDTSNTSCSIASNGYQATVATNIAVGTSTKTFTITSAQTTNYNAASATYTLSTNAAVAYNTINGVSTYYTTLKSAFNASTTGTTTLLSNTTENLSTSSSTNKTLNLNGKTLTGVIINNNSGASLTINGGTITNSKDRTIYNAGTMNISGTSISGTYTGFSEAIYNTSTGTMSFTDCSISTGTTYKINNANTNSFIQMVRSFNSNNVYDKMNGKFMGHGVSGNGNYEVNIKGAAITHCPTWSSSNGQDDIVWHTATKYYDYYYCQFSKTAHGTGSTLTHFYYQSSSSGSTTNKYIAGMSYTSK